MGELGIAMLDDAEWTSLEKAVDALEESWQTSGEADLTQLVPPPDDPLYSQALVQLIKIDQEYRYRAGFPKPLEAYLDEWPALTTDPDLTAELLATECQTRIIADTPPNDQELRTRFPVIAARIDLAEIAARVERESRSTMDIKEAEETGLKAIVGPVWPVEQPPARYQIREVLGRGGMGTVYRAYDTQLDREVALKVPCIDLGDDPAVRERFFREAKAVARISHPNVCQVFDAGESGGGYYIAMALIEGQSLAARLQQGSLDCRQAAELVCKLARALGVVHAGGIIHRDLKPQNVMLDTQGEPLLTDFGLARPVQADGHLTGTYSLLGTPAYMSPEQMHGDPAGTTSDIYALGVILYQVLTGRLPFSGPPAQLPLNIVRGNPPRPRKLRPEVDPGLEAICLKAMAKRPGDRFQMAEEMAEALQRYLDGPPQPAGPPRRIRRLARLAGAGAAAILLLAVIFHVKTNVGTLVLEVVCTSTGNSAELTVVGQAVPVPGVSDLLTYVSTDAKFMLATAGHYPSTRIVRYTRDSVTDPWNGPVDYQVPGSELLGYLSPDGNTVYYYSYDPWPSGRSMIGRSRRVGGTLLDPEWSAREEVPGADTGGNSFGGAFNGNKLYWNSCFSVGSSPGDIYEADYDAAHDQFVNMHKLDLGKGTSSWDDQAPWISSDGSLLIFGSNRPGGYGGWDLWYATWDSSQGKWSDSINLGPNVNTTGTETLPRLAEDAGILFFSRDDAMTPMEATVVPERSSLIPVGAGAIILAILVGAGAISLLAYVWRRRKRTA